jgi:tetratricopeptide (TPR) repeat protein
MRRRFLFLLGAFVLATGVVLLGGVLATDPAAPAPAVRADAAATRILDGFAAGDTVTYVEQLRARVARDASDREALRLLGLAYQQRARETGDPAFYPRAEAALRRAVELGGGDTLAFTGLAALAASRHRFGEAASFARRALRRDSRNAAAYGILGDALVETGRYAEAFAAFERAVTLKPNAAAYARISYARELLGRTRGAIAAMRLAVRAAEPAEEPTAWALTQLGTLYRDSGRLSRAERTYRRALARMPGYAPARAALASVRQWQGRLVAAASLYRAALAAQPLPEYAVGLGDTLARDGDAAGAQALYARASELERAFAASGGRNALETALFDLDHDRDLADALARAREARSLRPSVEGEHVLAWALYKNGRCGRARMHSARALRLGTKDWGAMIHRSLIESCLGNEIAARTWRKRAVAANPFALAAFGPLPGQRTATP